MLKRIWLFLLTNIAILALISLITFILETYFNINISNLFWSYTWLLIYSAIFWFLWSFTSLFLSKWIAKRSHKIRLLNKNDLYSFTQKEKFVYSTVEELARRNNIKLPEIWVYTSSEQNAFATWPSKNNSLVAVSSWLLDIMSDEEIEAIIAHEISHITSWDMVTMTLLQWVLNTFVIFFARIVTNIIESYLEDWLWNIAYFIVNITLQILFWLFASLIIMKFSRYREFKADEWSAKLVWKEKMIKALDSLRKSTDLIWKDLKLATMKINDKQKKWIWALFSSHPTIDARIKRLEGLKV